MSRIVIAVLALVSVLPCPANESIAEKVIKAPPNEPNLITFSRIDKAWKYSQGENTKVAILDWLFDMSPKASYKYINPVCMIPGEKIGFAEAWHGEWMAETAHQVAPKAKIIPIRARPARKESDRDTDGRFIYERYLIKGIRFAADQGAVAVTNSMGPVKHCDELKAAIDYAEKKGTIFINVHPEYLVYTKNSYKKCDPNDLDKRIIHSGIVYVPEHSAARDSRIGSLKPVLHHTQSEAPDA